MEISVLVIVSLLIGGTAATVTLTVESQVTCGNDITLICTYTGSLGTGVNRFWRKGITDIVTGGVSSNTQKYTEDSSGSQNFKLTISSFEATDADDYTCVNVFDTDTLAVSCTVIYSASVSHPARFVNDDCRNFECLTDNYSPLCGTDGVTYDSPCEMSMANKKRLCWIGHYNMIMKQHDGPCGLTTATPAPKSVILS